MHREHLVVEVCVQYLAVRGCELETDENGLEATDDEEEQRGRRVHDAELLVVDGEHP